MLKNILCLCVSPKVRNILRTMYVFQTINSVQQCTAFPSICFIRVEDEFIKIGENENKLLFDIFIQDFSNPFASV